jgi:hypothetical protein
MSSPRAVDVHQHLWPPEFVEALRRRRSSPRLDGWLLLLDGEPPYEVSPQHHDVAWRQDVEINTDLALVSVSCALGIEEMVPDQAQELLDAWHDGVANLPAPFGAWASFAVLEPDLAGLATLLNDGFVGVQVPAPAMATPAGLEALAPALELCQSLDRPVFVHPGRVDRHDAAHLPGWWPPVVDYVHQLHSAWWTWQHAGRMLLPDLRICFAAGAGLAPLHHERFAARGGDRMSSDAGVYVDTSSYASQGLRSLAETLGIGALVLGSDRPYAQPTDPELGPEATHAIRVVNPRRLLSANLR